MVYRSRMESFYRRYQRIYQSKIRELLMCNIENGTVSAVQINAYLVQDIHYMEALAIRLNELAESGALGEQSKSVLRRDATLTEDMVKDWTSFLRENGIGKINEGMNDRTADYIEHQRRAVQQGPQAGLAAILPCYLYCYDFVDAVRNAITNAKIADAITTTYLGRFAKRLHTYNVPSWNYDILKIWEEVTLTDGRSFKWSDLMEIFRQSSTHEWRILECASPTDART